MKKEIIVVKQKRTDERSEMEAICFWLAEE